MDIHKLSEELEIISQTYAQKYGITRDPDWFVLKLQEELGELIQSYLMLRGQARMKGKTSKEIRQDFNNEVADVFGQLVLLAKHFEVDLDKVIEEKWLIWNKDRQQ